MKELLPVRLPVYFDRTRSKQCPECHGFLEDVGFRREIKNQITIIVTPLLVCRNCRGLFEEVDRDD